VSFLTAGGPVPPGAVCLFACLECAVDSLLDVRLVIRMELFDAGFKREVWFFWKHLDSTNSVSMQNVAGLNV